MGWFWAEKTPASLAVAPHPLSRAEASPPPGCPMHTSPDTPSSFPPLRGQRGDSSSCPVKSPSSPYASQTPPFTSTAQAPQPEASSTLSKLNPLNYMPASLSQSRAPNQAVNLPLERETSSIPRGDAETNWEYPSPQQMYNAMLRKGYTDTPADAVESMVAVHNFLNEGAWQQIVEWEQIFGEGLKKGWQRCKRGEEERLRNTWKEPEATEQPRLVRFMGRPKDMTPRAVMLQVMGRIYPGGFGNEPPFDRHDWYVARRTPDGGQQEIRYVIDYYSAPPEPTGEPVFYLDIRPAVDGPTAAAERMIRWGGDVWWRASGAAVREANKSS